jgi:hypothetical protein
MDARLALAEASRSGLLLTMSQGGTPRTAGEWAARVQAPVRWTEAVLCALADVQVVDAVGVEKGEMCGEDRRGDGESGPGHGGRSVPCASAHASSRGDEHTTLFCVPAGRASAVRDMGAVFEALFRPRGKVDSAATMVLVKSRCDKILENLLDAQGEVARG